MKYVVLPALLFSLFACGSESRGPSGLDWDFPDADDGTVNLLDGASGEGGAGGEAGSGDPDAAVPVAGEGGAAGGEAGMGGAAGGNEPDAGGAGTGGAGGGDAGEGGTAGGEEPDPPLPQPTPGRTCSVCVTDDDCDPDYVCADRSEDQNGASDVGFAERVCLRGRNFVAPSGGTPGATGSCAATVPHTASTYYSWDQRKSGLCSPTLGFSVEQMQIGTKISCGDWLELHPESGL